MYHLRKAITAAARDDFSSKLLEQREALMGAMHDAGSVLGDYARAVLGAYNFNLEAYLPHLLDVMDKLDVACRAIGANSSTYRGFRKCVLGQQPTSQWYPPPPAAAAAAEGQRTNVSAM